MDIMKFIKQNLPLILSFIYIISPIDILPEAFLGPLGIIDDLGVVVFMLGYSFIKFIFGNSAYIAKSRSKPHLQNEPKEKIDLKVVETEDLPQSKD